MITDFKGKTCEGCVYFHDWSDYQEALCLRLPPQATSVNALAYYPHVTTATFACGEYVENISHEDDNG